MASWRRPLTTIPRPALVGFGIAAMLALSACQSAVRVTVVVRPAGDGEVTVSLRLDKEAAARFPDLAGQLRVDDLRRAGWTLSGPAIAGDGSASVVVRRRFHDPAEATTLLAQLTGPDGPLHSLQVRYHRSLLTTSARVSGTVDLRGGADAFADRGLAQQLGFATLAQALAALAQAGGTAPALRVEFAAQLPGGVQRAPGSHLDHGTAVWTADLGHTVAVDAASSRRNRLNLILLGVAGASLLGLAVVGLSRVIGPVFRGDARRGKHRRRRHRRDDTWRIAERRHR